MRLKQDYVSSQFHQLYFELSPKEVNEIFEEVADENSNLTDQNSIEFIEKVKDKIEYETIQIQINELDVYMIGPKMITYLTDVKKDNIVLGIAKFCILPEELNIELPTYIPSSFIETNVTKEQTLSTINKILICNDYYDLIEVSEVDETSVITYDLCYTNNGTVLNKIENQTFDMSEVTDENVDIDPLKFEKKKKDDIVILDNEEVKVEARIKKIEKKVAKELTDEIVKNLKFLRVTTATGFEKKINEIYKFGKTLDLLVYYVTEFIIQNKQIEFDSYVVDFYQKYASQCNLPTDNIDYDSGIKRMLIIEYLSAIIDAKYEDENIMHVGKIYDEQALAQLLDGSDLFFDDAFFDHRMEELKIFNYCENEKIIDFKI